MRNPTPKSRTSLSLRFLAWTTVLLICLCGPGCRNEKAPPAELSGSGRSPPWPRPCRSFPDRRPRTPMRWVRPTPRRKPVRKIRPCRRAAAAARRRRRARGRRSRRRDPLPQPARNPSVWCCRTPWRRRMASYREESARPRPVRGFPERATSPISRHTRTIRPVNGTLW